MFPSSLLGREHDGIGRRTRTRAASSLHRWRSTSLWAQKVAKSMRRCKPIGEVWRRLASHQRRIKLHHNDRFVSEYPLRRGPFVRLRVTLAQVQRTEHPPSPRHGTVSRLQQRTCPRSARGDPEMRRPPFGRACMWITGVSVITLFHRGSSTDPDNSGCLDGFPGRPAVNRSPGHRLSEHHRSAPRARTPDAGTIDSAFHTGHSREMIDSPPRPPMILLPDRDDRDANRSFTRLGELRTAKRAAIRSSKYRRGIAVWNFPTSHAVGDPLSPARQGVSRVPVDHIAAGAGLVNRSRTHHAVACRVTPEECEARPPDYANH
ncbi:hypothetical protein H4W33_004945 [Kibdelosporangium phytohabitans]|nr:hypothetical protein [Kibdelosporangium phytohabitans]